MATTPATSPKATATPPVGSWVGPVDAKEYYAPPPSVVQPKPTPPPASLPQAKKIILAKPDANVFPSSGAGRTLVDTPIKVTKAAEHLASKPEKIPYAETLGKNALASYAKRLEKINKQGFGVQVAKEMGSMANDAFVKPIKRLVQPVINNVTGHYPDEEGAKMLTTVNDLMIQKKYNDAHTIFDEYQAKTLDKMSDHDLLMLDAEHPLVADMAHQAGVMTMQYSLLRNAPFLGELGNSMEAGAAKFIGSIAPETATLKTVSTYGKLASQLAGDIPANLIMPVMNFDFEHRPISELPTDIVNNLALMVPTALGFHMAGSGISEGSAAAIKAGAKVIGVMKSLRMPITQNTGKALEKAALGEADNALTRILDAMPAERRALMEHFQSVRANIESENRLAYMKGGNEGRPGIDYPMEPPRSGADKIAARLKDMQKITSDTVSSDELKALKDAGYIIRDPVDNTLIFRQKKDFIPKPVTGKAFDKTIDSPGFSKQEMDFMTRIGIRPVKRSTRAGIRDLMKNPAPEVDILQPPTRSLWFQDALDMMAPERKIGTKAGKVASELIRQTTDSNEPVKAFKNTYNLLKSYPKQVSQKTEAAWDSLGAIYNKHFNSVDEVQPFNKYEVLLQMRSRAEEGLSNPGAAKLGIPDNAPLEVIEQMIAELDTPQYRAAHAELKKWDNATILNNLLESKRITPEIARQWQEKYPDHVTFMYDKYMRTSDGSPHKTYDFTPRDYLSSITGGEGLELRTNLFDTRMRSASRAISDLHTDAIAGSLRQEMGLAPLKVRETASGRRFQAIVEGKMYDFDARDLESGVVPGLEGQRVLYSQYDKRAFLVPEKVYNVVKNVKEKGGMFDFLSPFTNAWRDMTTTYNPAFAAVTNPARDLQNALLLTNHSTKDFLGAYLNTARDLIAHSLSPNGPKGKIIDMPLDEGAYTHVQVHLQKAMDWMAKKIGTEGYQQFWQDFTESGGAQGGYYAFQSTAKNEKGGVMDALKSFVDKSDPEYSLAKVNTKFIENGVIRTAVRMGNIIAVPFKSIKEIGGFFEKLPRGAEFRLELAKTGDMAQASARASDITVDFFKIGEVMRKYGLKNIAPFTNANWQGNTNLVKGLIGADKKNAAAAAAVFAARGITTYVGLPAALWYMAKQAGVWDRADDVTKANYFMIPTGKTWTDEFGEERPVVVTIRKGEAAQMITPVVESMLDYWYSKDPGAFNNIKDFSFADSLAAKLHPLPRTFLEVASNHSFYRGTQIDPDTLLERPKELRYYKGTTDIGKKLGDMLGVSGNMGDYVLQNMAPAPYKYYKAAIKSTEKNTAMNLGEIFNVIQTPSVFFEDQELQKQQKAVIDQMKKIGRTTNVRPQDRVTAQQRLMKEIYTLQEMVDAKQKQREQYPLEGTPVMNPVDSFIAAGREERKQLIKSLTNGEVKELIRRGIITPKKK